MKFKHKGHNNIKNDNWSPVCILPCEIAKTQTKNRTNIASFWSELKRVPKRPQISLSVLMEDKKTDF